MLDRVIGIAGLALTLIFWALPFVMPTVPAWVSKAGLAFGIFVLGASLGLLVADVQPGRAKANARASTALLRLHSYGDHRVPDALSAEGVFRWYVLHNSFIFRDSQGKEQAVGTVNLFISFEPEVEVSTLRVTSPDMPLPLYEVKEFNQRFAIIAFAGNLAAGTLEISVRP